MTAKEKTNIGPRITPTTRDFYEKTFETTNAGAEFALQAFPTLYRRSLREIWGVFTPEEVCLLIDLLNSVFLQPELLGQHILADLEDAIALDHIDEKWGVAGKELVSKVQALPLFQAVALEIFAKGFWWGKHADPKEYAKTIAV